MNNKANFIKDYAPSERQLQSDSKTDIGLLFSMTFFTGLILVIVTSMIEPKPSLENHPMCGITTGGKEECLFECGMVSCANLYPTLLTSNLSCILSCFENSPDNCVRSLLNDVIKNGVCDRTNPDTGLNIYGPGLWPETQNCEITFPEVGYIQITKGTCSDATEALLLKENCKQTLLSPPTHIVTTLFTLIFSSCRRPLFEHYAEFIVQNNIRRSNGRRESSNATKIAPFYYVLEDFNIRTRLQYNNTRHRYPWVCSLRSRGSSPAHRCAVNLLSIPPEPTVIVGAAHCTYICKDGAREVPTCCCSDSTDDCKETNPKCGDNPGVVEMTGADSIILCGEWDTSMADSVASGERYNVELPILEIVRHPDFDPAKGPINGNDIAVFKVDDRNIQNNVAETYQLWPACLPSQTNQMPLTGIHTGWSEPPPFSYLQSVAPGFTKFYGDFYKQWHFKMDIYDICEDPERVYPCDPLLQFPSNTSYPPGTICAKEFAGGESCFSTGDSGSPLMVKNDVDPERYQIEGVLSFVKGCTIFLFGVRTTNSDKQTSILYQQTENPSVYTKLVCFLPWVASQYNMRYVLPAALEKTCSIGSGDPNNEKQPCRNVPSDLDRFTYVLNQEFECKFPFFYNGKKYEECILLFEDDFLFPIFRCPIRDIDTKIDGINSFVSPPLVNGYCLSNPSDEHSPLNSTQKECLVRRLPFVQCKNDCPGVRAFGIVGGGAVLAGVTALGSLSTLPSLLGVGAIGAAGVGGGMMVAQSMCAAPFFCNIPSGKCCVVTFSINGIVCPDSC